MKDNQIIENLTQKLEEATGRNNKLESALKDSQTCLNSFALIHGNRKHSNAEKCSRAEKLIRVHMDDIFTTNKELLTTSE